MDWISAVDPSPDQPLILSVVCERSRAGWTLAHGSALFVSQACADVSWGEWRRDAFTSDPDQLPSAFWLERGDIAWGRAAVGFDEGRDWIRDVDSLVAGASEPIEVSLPGLGNIPSLRATLVEPAAMQLVCTKTDVPAAQLAMSAGRTLRALALPSPQTAPIDVPMYVEDGAWTTTAPGMDLVGMSLWEGNASQMPRGLLVGAMDERLWIWAMRTEPGLERVNLDFEFDQERVDLLDLVITHEQWIGDALVLSRANRVDEIDGIRAHRGDSIRLSFESIGSRSKHEFVIRNSAGDLLDRVGPYGFIEHIEIAMNVNGEEARSLGAGARRTLPSFSDRARRQGEIRSADVASSAQAAADRFMDDRTTALQRLREEIERAHGELLIIDPYFGQRDLSEWRLLDNVNVPVRVVAKKPFAPGAQVGANVRARQVPGASMHDRHYIWSGSGLRVGGSPSTFGQAPIAFDRVPASEIAHIRSQFEAYWLDPRAVDLVP